MAFPPLNGTLLRRTVKPAFDDAGDYYIAREYWYDPDTRTAVNGLISPTTDGNPYSKPTTEIVDRWCVAPGSPPYTEVRVFHDGMGGIVSTPFDGVDACQVVCTLGVALTAAPSANGRFDLAATATQPQGPVVFSLDGFATPGIAPTPGAVQRYTFPALRPGTYTITAKETRAAGCTATADITLSAVYGPRYAHAFKDADDTTGLLQIFERDYTGPVEALTGQPNVVVLDWPGGATDHLFTSLVRGSECRLALYLTTTDQLLPLFSGDERLHQVRYSRDGELFWKGYLLPEQYDVQFLAPPNTFDLAATDGLGALSTVPFAGPAGQALRGDWTKLEIIIYCLNKLDLDFPLNVVFNLFPVGATTGAGALGQIRVDVGQYVDDKLKPWDCGKVLLEVLKPYSARLYQQQGAWWLERLIELSIEPLTYASYGPDGVRGADVTRSLLYAIERGGPLHWQDARQRQSLRPAVSTVTVTADAGELANQLRPWLPKNSDLPAALPVAWTSYNSGIGPLSELVYQGKDKAPLLRLFGATANAYTPEVGPAVQTPNTSPLPQQDLAGTNTFNQALVLTFTAKPYGNTPVTVPNPTPLQQSAMYVALRFGNVWLQRYDGFTPIVPDSPAPVLIPVPFPDDKEVAVRIAWQGTTLRAPQPVAVRLYAPVGGPTAATVDISDLQLVWQADDAPPVASYTGDTGQLVTRVDTDLTLFHADTPLQRLAGSLLDGGGVPTTGWFEPDALGQNREVGDYLVRDRLVWQGGPAQVLIGTLRGYLPGPGVLLTDPAEVRPAVYVLASATHDAARATWDVGAVQDRVLMPPPLLLPDDAIYNEYPEDDPTAWESESGRILVYEHATA